MTVDQQICLCLFCAGFGAWLGAETQQNKTERKVMAKLSELAGLLNASLALSDKVLSEVSKLSADFEALKAQLSDIEIPAEASVAIGAINAKFAALDALIADSESPQA